MKHWVFDLDGTLIDSHTTYFLTLSDLFRHYGLNENTIDREKAAKLFGRDFLQLHFPEHHLNEAYGHLVRLNTERAHEVQAFAGIQEIIEELKAHDKTVSVWTGRDHESAYATLVRIGLSQHLSHFVSCSIVKNNKPHPEGLLKIINDSGHQPDELVMIGDTHFDIDGARGANVKAVSVSWNDAQSADHLKKISDHHFHTVGEFRTWLKNHL